MDAERNEKRARMLEKVRKLLAIGRDGRGNEHEEAIAMRQASKLMAEWGIEEAEADLSAIAADAMQFGESEIRPDGKDAGNNMRSTPSWAGVIGVGVARFTDTFCRQRMTERGVVLVFQGERNDVLLARWLFGVLVTAVQHEQRNSGWTSRGDANAFRRSAASALQNRMTAIARERRQVYEQAKATSGSRALVVVDKKLAIMEDRFGKQTYSKTRGSRSGDYGAREAGRSAGNRINIPSGRPLGSETRAKLK